MKKQLTSKKSKSQTSLDASDVVAELEASYSLYREGILTIDQLFLRWQAQGDLIALCLSLPPPDWKPLPSLSQVHPAIA